MLTQNPVPKIHTPEFWSLILACCSGFVFVLASFCNLFSLGGEQNLLQIAILLILGAIWYQLRIRK